MRFEYDNKCYPECPNGTSKLINNKYLCINISLFDIFYDLYKNNNSNDEIIKNINPALLIIDFNPILKRNYLKNIDCKVYEIDGHNIIPARYVSDKDSISDIVQVSLYFSIVAGIILASAEDHIQVLINKDYKNGWHQYMMASGVKPEKIIGVRFLLIFVIFLISILNVYIKGKFVLITVSTYSPFI